MTGPLSLEVIFSRALEFDLPAERSRFLDRSCAGDAVLRREIDSLLAAHLSAAFFLEPLVPRSDEMPSENSGDWIGRYRLCERIGEGGFGTVWMAEQSEPVKRRVALKIVKLGMDTREVLARFRVEQQALALMDHPHIARVYDGGATEGGRPYFVMELVNGSPVNRYCSEHKLGIRERLELFIDVAAAVQHAHQKGVIHRDLKPSNILVSTQEGKPVVKVIDFGIAKAVSMDFNGTAVMTAFGRMIGTPEYMSPEQAELNALDVDTRSDIYALGVLLYELLTGTTPLDPVALRKAGFSEMQRMIREVKPLKPSSRIATLKSSPDAARSHASPPWPCDGMIGREIDWVVMQALEKDRSRRYQTANGIGMDVRRFLDDEPVSASPPSATYRIVKFAKRHRFAAVWTGLFVVVIFVAAIGMTLLYFDAEKKATVAREQRIAAETEREKAVDAEGLAESRTWEALMSQATALRWSGKPERRFLALGALEEATAITSQHDEPRNLKRLRDSTIACLAIADMRPVDSWKGNPAYGEMVAAAPSMSAFASTLPDGRILVHSYPAHRLVSELPGEGTPVRQILRFSPDGRHLAAAYGDPAGWEMKLWTKDGEWRSMGLGPGIRKAFAYCPDGKDCIIARPDSKLSMIDLASGREIRQLALPSPPHALAVSKQGQWIAASIPATGTHPGSVEILDAIAGSRLASLPCSALPVAWSPFDDSLAVGCQDGAVRVWHDREWSVPPMVLEGHAAAVDSLAWSPDGRLLISQAGDGTVRLWDPFQGAALGWHPGRGGDLELVDDGGRLWALLREGETLTLLEVEPGDVCYRGRRHASGGSVFDGAWNPAGSLLATTGDDGVRLWNREGRQLGYLKIARARGVAFSADSLFVGSAVGLCRWPVEERVAAGGGLGIRLGEPQLIGSLESCEQLSLWREGHLIAIAGRRGTEQGQRAVWLLDLKGEAGPRRLEAPPGVASCSISPDGRWLAAGTSEGKGVRIWPVAGGTPHVDLPIHGSARVAFSPDCKWLLTGDTEAYRFWRTGTWLMEHEIPSGMSGSSGLMAFSPRMTALIIACRRAELKVLDPYTLEELCSPDFDRETPLCFDPFGRLMITVSPSGGVFFWKLDAVRARLVEMGLDWKHMRRFPDLVLPLVESVEIPAASFQEMKKTPAGRVDPGR